VSDKANSGIRSVRVKGGTWLRADKITRVGCRLSGLTWEVFVSGEVSGVFADGLRESESRNIAAELAEALWGEVLYYG
jgi:hypothetical protein